MTSSDTYNPDGTSTHYETDPTNGSETTSTFNADGTLNYGSTTYADGSYESFE